MGFKMQVRRGAESALPELDSGELGYAEDTRRLYVGTDIGAQRIANYKDVTDYVNTTYSEVQSLVRDVSYLKLMAETDDRVDSGTTFGTDFVKHLNLEMHDAFGVVKQAGTIDSQEFEIEPIEGFVIGEYVTLFDENNMEEVIIEDIDGSKITFSMIVNNYPNGFHVARSMTGDSGTFDKRRFAALEPTPEQENVYGGTGTNLQRNIAITKLGTVVVASLNENIIEVRALDMKKAAPTWVTTHYITAPAGVVFGAPSVTHSYVEEDAVVLMWHNQTDKNFRAIRVPVDKFYSGNLYSTSYVVTPTSPIRSLSALRLITNSGAQVDTEQYYYVAAMRTDASPTSSNIYSGTLKVNTSRVLSALTMVRDTNENTSTINNTNPAIVDSEFGTSFGKGRTQTFYRKNNDIEHAYTNMIGNVARKVVSGAASATRSNTTAVYVPPVDVGNPDDFGQIHVAWQEQLSGSLAADIVHIVSTDNGLTFSEVVNLTNVNPSINSAFSPNLTASGDGKVYLTYVLKTIAQDDTETFTLMYKDVATTGAGAILEAGVYGSLNYRLAQNPHTFVIKPVVAFYLPSTNITRMRGSFTREITKKKNVNHMRFKLTKPGIELAMWVAKQGEFDISAIVNGVPITGFDDGNETEFTRAVGASQLFDVTLVLTRDAIETNDSRRVTTISGGVS